MSVAPDRARATAWGSDAVARVLENGGVGLVTCMPGSTLRGLIETLLANGGPVPLVESLHESSAVAIAHGYTKTAGRPAAVLLHSSVGLLNAAMAVYNAALDFAPLVLVVGTRPRDPERRRPWIDRIHAGEELAPLMSNLAKRVTVAGSLEETLGSLADAIAAACEPPCGPVVIFVDRDTFEEPFGQDQALPAPGAAAGMPPSAADVDAVAAALGSASHAVLLAGRLGLDGWAARVRIAESAGFAVLTDLRLPAAFPTSHGRYAGGLDVQGRPFGEAQATLEEADLVLALGWEDPRAVSEIGGWGSRPPAVVFDVRIDDLLPAPLAAQAETFAISHHRISAQPQALLEALEVRGPLGDAAARSTRRANPAGPRPDELDGALTLAAVAGLLRDVFGSQPTTLVKVPVEWQGHWWEIDDGLAYLGYDGGGGLGSGPGLLVGAALGLESTRLAVAVLGDGDVLMGVQALWNAAASGVAALLVVIDNEGYANEARHFEKVAAIRGRPTDWAQSVFPFRAHPVGVGGIAREFGLQVLGPAADVDATRDCIESSLSVILSGRPVVVHLRIADPTATAG
jgi:thiamine pyrophosphate-dependent acetolactate synthase large subunit-like protein